MAAKLLGQNYFLWIESSTPGTYNFPLGQDDLTVNRSLDPIDTSTKDDGGYATSAPGLRKLTLDFNIVPKLPDANGYTRLETLCFANPSAPFNVQIRKGGAAGANGDVVFQCLMYGSLDSTGMGKGDAVKVKCTLTAAGAPTTDALA